MKRALVLACLLAAVTIPRSSRAESDAQRALKLAYEGDSLYAKGDWTTAYDRFAAADTAAHSPVFVLYMARCRKNAGKLREARALYDRVAHEDLSTSAPKPFREAVSDATRERDDVARRIPLVAITITGAPAGAAPLVKIDRGDVPSLAAPIPLDPGAHVIEATSGSASARKEVRLEDGGGMTKVELALASGATKPVPSTPIEPKRGSLAPGVVALVIGVAGVGVGAGTGLVASSKASDVKSRCVDGHCLKSDASELDQSRTFATVSTIGFVAGGVAVAAAAVLFAVRPGGSSASAPSSALRVAIGPASVDVRGTF